MRPRARRKINSSRHKGSESFTILMEKETAPGKVGGRYKTKALGFHDRK